MPSDAPLPVLRIPAAQPAIEVHMTMDPVAVNTTASSTHPTESTHNVAIQLPITLSLRYENPHLPAHAPATSWPGALAPTLATALNSTLGAAWRAALGPRRVYLLSLHDRGAPPRPAEHRLYGLFASERGAHSALAQALYVYRAEGRPVENRGTVAFARGDLGCFVAGLADPRPSLEDAGVCGCVVAMEVR